MSRVGRRLRFLMVAAAFPAAAATAFAAPQASCPTDPRRLVGATQRWAPVERGAFQAGEVQLGADQVCPSSIVLSRLACASPTFASCAYCMLAAAKFTGRSPALSRGAVPAGGPPAVSGGHAGATWRAVETTVAATFRLPRRAELAQKDTAWRKLTGLIAAPQRASRSALVVIESEVHRRRAAAHRGFVNLVEDIRV